MYFLDQKQYEFLNMSGDLTIKLIKIIWLHVLINETYELLTFFRRMKQKKKPLNICTNQRKHTIFQIYGNVVFCPALNLDHQGGSSWQTKSRSLID